MNIQKRFIKSIRKKVKMEWPFFEMGIIILIFGPEAFKDYVYDCFKYMKWQSFFGAERYNWLLQDVEKVHRVLEIL